MCDGILLFGILLFENTKTTYNEVNNHSNVVLLSCTNL